MAKEKLFASVVIPAYNSASTISECIQALRKQEFDGNFEIIVVDDGSTDSTAQVVKNMEVKVIKQANSGPAKARNNGARNSQADILLFTDSDCIPERNWVAEMVKPFREKNVVGVQGAYKTRQQSIVARFCQVEIEERYELMKKNSASLDWIGSYSAGYRKKDFFQAGGFDESFPKASGEDPELSYKLEKAGKRLAFNPQAVVYHMHPDTIWKYFWSKFGRGFYRVNLYSKHKDKIVKDSYTTWDLKLQVACSYLGTALFLLSIGLLYIGDIPSSVLALGASTVFTIVGIASTLKLAIFAAKTDIGIAIFSFIGVGVRTLAFTLGLLAGIIDRTMGK